jgi:hypothetical protein
MLKWVWDQILAFISGTDTPTSDEQERIVKIELLVIQILLWLIVG